MPLALDDRTSAAQDQRRCGRTRVIKRAQLTFGASVLDCVVLDLSLAGAKASLASATPVPELFTVRFRDGVCSQAHRRWARGTEIGLEFAGPGLAADAERRRQVEAIRRAVGHADPARAMAMLRDAGFLSDEALRRAAEAAELAHERLMAALQAHAGGLWTRLEPA